ncbi:hypothetical protein OIU78_009023 [Salix suchowensis]|nr:hypothetical protein OIU78_009023 [Salix suchowensis]
MSSLLLLVLVFLVCPTPSNAQSVLVESFNIFSGGLSKINSFGDVGFTVCGSIGRFVVDVMVVLSQAGFCVGYLIFIANTLANLFNSSSPDSLGSQILALSMSAKSWYIWGCFPVQLGLNSIATLTHLAPLSIFADVVDLAAMGVVIVKDVFIMMENRPEVRAFGGLSVFFYGMGVAVYAFEGIGPGLISLLVQLGLCINLFFTFPLMMNPVYEIVERRFWGGRYCLWLRWVSVLVVTVVALMVPNFADFLSLVGSSVCCGLGFVLPALFHLLVFREEMSWKGWSIDAGIVALGLVLAVSGTWYALMEIFAVRV